MHAWHIAAGAAERARARAFTVAFGVRDILWTFTFIVVAAYYYGIMGSGLQGIIDKTDPMGIVLSTLYQGAVIVYVPLVAYGMLRVQLFDIDLRIKRGLKRGTIAAMFVATFFVISELASIFLSERFGAVIGVLSSGVLVFFFEHLQRAAQGLANAAMPNTQDTPEYENFRKLQVYDAALRTALEDGVISDRQRRLLDSLIESMKIDRTLALRLEADLVSERSLGTA
jgi:hypothetical protein